MRSCTSNILSYCLQKLVDPRVLEAGDVVGVVHVGERRVPFRFGIGKEQAAPGHDAPSETCRCVDQLELRLRSDEPEIQADADLAQVLLIHGQLGLD